MTREYKTIGECARLWVDGFDAIDSGMIEHLMEFEMEDWEEVTLPSLSDRVYVYDMPVGIETDERYGEIVGIETDECEQNNVTYDIELYDGTRVTVNSECFDVERDSCLPMWGTMWQFHDPCDTYWIEEQNGIEALSQCGFRVYYSEQFGYFFGIDGCGYDFYLAHFIPLYRARGLKWHDVED